MRGISWCGQVLDPRTTNDCDFAPPTHRAGGEGFLKLRRFRTNTAEPWSKRRGSKAGYSSGWLGSTPRGRRPQIRGLRAGGSLAIASSAPATQPRRKFVALPSLSSAVRHALLGVSRATPQEDRFHNTGELRVYREAQTDLPDPLFIPDKSAWPRLLQDRTGTCKPGESGRSRDIARVNETARRVRRSRVKGLQPGRCSG